MLSQEELSFVSKVKEEQNKVIDGLQVPLVSLLVLDEIVKTLVMANKEESLTDMQISSTRSFLCETLGAKENRQMNVICSDDCRQSGTPFDICPEEKEVWALEEEQDKLYDDDDRVLTAAEKVRATEIHERLKVLRKLIPTFRCNCWLGISYDDPDMFCDFKGTSYNPSLGFQTPKGEEKKEVDAYLAELKARNVSANNVGEWLS